LNALRSTSRIARGASLLSLGALAVHELRYWLAYGRGAGEALAHQGHGYVSDLGGVLVVLALATLLATLLAGALAPPPRAAHDPPGAAFRRTAGLHALALAAIFCAQELTEGAIAAGHPAGLAAVLAHGGWVFLPLACARWRASHSGGSTGPCLASRRGVAHRGARRQSPGRTSRRPGRRSRR